MTVRNSFAGLPAFLFGDGGLHNQLVCDVRTYVRANDGSRDLLAPMLAWSPGPPAIGDTGDNSPSHMLGTTWLLQVCPDGSWVLYREDRGRLEVMPFDDPPANVTSTARHVSLCFDQAARVALAWEDQGIIKVRRWDPSLNEYIENVSFAGHDPVVVFDAQWAYQIPNSDVLLFYLSPDRTRLLCRVQRDVYAVERQVWDYGQPVILDRVIALPYRYQVLVSDSDGVPLPSVLVSDQYPVALTTGVRLEPEFLEGEFRQVAYQYESSVGVQLVPEFIGGALTLPVTTYSPLIGVELSPEFHSGALKDAVTQYAPTLGVELAPEFVAGALDDIGVPYAPSLGVELAPEFIGGVYEPG